MKSLLVKSPAKINLFLKVLGKRPDGFHELLTLMQEVSLFDHLRFTQITKGIDIRSDYLGLPLDKSNLVWKAANLIKKTCGIKKGVRIKITKNIPVGAGLGGGSSNAAYTLKALNQFWNLKLSRAELLLLASKLGSDVPFFIYGKAALCKGRGEIVFSAKNTPKNHYIIAFPGFSVPTKNIYKKLNFGLTNGNLRFTLLVNHLFGNMPNDLERAAFKIYPNLKKVKRTLKSCGLRKIVLCGSGSAFFGPVKTRKEGDKFLKRIRKLTGNAYKVYHAQSL